MVDGTPARSPRLSRCARAIAGRAGRHERQGAAWLAPESFAVPPPFATALHALGYIAIPCRPGATDAHEAKLRVLFTSAFTTSDEWAHAYAVDTRPTVIVAATADAAADALALARAGDEVARADDSPAALGLRLSRRRARGDDEELATRRGHRNPVTGYGTAGADVGFWQFDDDAALGKCKALLLFDPTLHPINRLEWSCDARNRASAAVAVKCGFAPEGVVRGLVFQMGDQAAQSPLFDVRITRELELARRRAARCRSR